jgi:prepilin-type N-terminal cleavage/methylation domain-containing protein
MNRKGFTLIELVVVILIIGVLASLGLPYYLKTVETAKATDALAIAHLLGNANRMYKADNPSYMKGQLTNDCNTKYTNCDTAPDNCKLVACAYVAKQNWEGDDVKKDAPYEFYVCNPTDGSGGGCCSNGKTACTRRKSDASSPYNEWTYKFDTSGRCTEEGKDVPTCPKY